MSKGTLVQIHMEHSCCCPYPTTPKKQLSPGRVSRILNPIRLFWRQFLYIFNTACIWRLPFHEEITSWHEISATINMLIRWSPYHNNEFFELMTTVQAMSWLRNAKENLTNWSIIIRRYWFIERIKYMSFSHNISSFEWPLLKSHLSWEINFLP